MKRLAELGGFGLGFVVGVGIGCAICAVIYALTRFA